MIWLTDRVDLLTAELDEMLDGGGLLARPPAVGAVFPFARLPDALELLNSGTTVGKVVVEVGDGTEAPSYGDLSWTDPTRQKNGDLYQSN